MKELTCDLHIVGGALTGLLTAYSIRRLGYKIIISERKYLNYNKQYTTKDTRTTAIAEGSKVFLEEIGLWRIIKDFVEPIKYINVIDANAKSGINFYNPKNGSSLGYIIKNSILIKALLSELKKRNNVKFLSGTALTSITYSQSKVIGISKDKKIYSKLIIAADGKYSTVRHLLKTGILKKEYNEKALVINFCHQKPHKNIAYEFFYNSGPLAILPMQSKKTKFQSALIWSNKSEHVDFMTSLKSNKKYIKEILNEKIYQKLGRITKINSLEAFPLSAHINERFYEERIIYVGDSAHSLHPIAGQGWNLGVRDVNSLTNILKKNKKFDQEIGSFNFCKSYHNSCYYDAYRLFQITDKLDWLFKKDQKNLKFFRSIGLGLIDKNRYLKNKIVNFAMGFN